MNLFTRAQSLECLYRLMLTWQTTPWRKECRAQASGILRECKSDYKKGGVDSLPWLALVDMIEEHGWVSHIRHYVKLVFGSSPSSQVTGQ